MKPRSSKAGWAHGNTAGKVLAAKLHLAVSSVFQLWRGVAVKSLKSVRY